MQVLCLYCVYVVVCCSSFECLQKAEEVLYRSFEPTLFLCRRLFLEGTKCPHSPLWWVDVSLGRILDLMDYLRMSIADSCEDFRDYLYASLSELNSAGAAGSAAFASCNLLMQTPHGKDSNHGLLELSRSTAVVRRASRHYT